MRSWLLRLGALRGARLGTTLLALWKLFRHPQTPRLPKLVALVVVAYALSPIDLIPDFIPVLGQLDDLILVPLGIALAIRLTPQALWQACLREAEAGADRLPRLAWGAVLVVVAWLVLLVAFGVIGWSMLATPAQAATRSWQGTVERVVDGDSLWLRPLRGGAPVEVRIADIDAPERCQPWGAQAGEALRSMLQGQAVTVQVAGRDEHGRTLATLRVGDLAVGDRLVRDGHAWSWRVRHDQGPLVAQEKMARALRRGLHAAGDAEEPRRFRQRHGPCVEGEGIVPPGVSVAPTAAPAPAPSTPAGATGAVVPAGCDGRTRCSQMRSCAEARWFLGHCPGVEMDGDHDGIPCETQWCLPPR